MIIIITNMKISETLAYKQKVVRKLLDLFFGFIRLYRGLSWNLCLNWAVIEGVKEAYAESKNLNSAQDTAKPISQISRYNELNILIATTPCSIIMIHIHVRNVLIMKQLSLRF
jgi:hypothetical protein